MNIDFLIITFDVLDLPESITSVASLEADFEVQMSRLNVLVFILDNGIIASAKKEFCILSLIHSKDTIDSGNVECLR